MKKQKLHYSESELQRTIIALLKYYHSVYVIRNNSFSGKIIRPNGSTGYVQNSKKGSPDLILCKNGLWIGIELKTEDGKQSPDQREAEKCIREAGGLYFIVRDVDEMEHVLNCI